MRYLYNILTYVLLPFALLRLLWRSRRNPAYRKRWPERFACFEMPQHYKHGIWIHAVSVGESLAAVPLVRALQKQHADVPIVVTTMTITGSDRIRAALGNSVFHIYIPYDCPTIVKRFLSKITPRIAVIMETELWPNLMHYCHKQNIPILLANARLSIRSVKGYRKFSAIVSKMLRKISVIAAQSQEDADRFRQLGATTEQLQIVGNVKFDLTIAPSTIESGEILRQQLGADRPRWIASSTHPGEETIILDAFARIKEKLPNALLILSPRHPEEFDHVEEICQDRGYQVTRRSSGKACTPETDIFLGDSMGEMMLFYGASDVAFVAGSLIPVGGHNLLEPALLKLPIISGKHLFNFAEISRLLLEANALMIVENAQTLAEKVLFLLSDMDARHAYGERAREVLDKNRGALERHIALIEQLANI